MRFIHLHVQSSYSLLNSSCKIDDLVEKAAELGYKALAITDENVMYGVIPFYKACKKFGIKPIIGLSLSIKVLHEGDKESLPLILLAETNQGYQNLLILSSLVQTKYKTGLPREWLKKYGNGLIAFSAFQSEINQLIVKNKYEDAREVALSFQSIFSNNFFISHEYHGLQIEKKVNQSLRSLCSELHIERMISHNVHYIEKKDALAYECLSAIKQGIKLSDNNKEINLKTEEYYFKSEDEMVSTFEDDTQALRATVQIAMRCNVNIELGLRLLPKYPLPSEESSSQYLRKLCLEGLKKRYEIVTNELKTRLDEELYTIQRMNFSDYFLIVWDFMKFAHENGILTGPGRGSAAGSLVAYVLNITDVDPLKYDLLFERFLNPERVSMPDIDIDFPDIDRDKVIQYVAQKYGSSHVAQIITFGTLAARAAVRDVGRVLGMDLKKIEIITKQISASPGSTIQDAIQSSNVLKEMISNSDEVKKLINIAITIEGLPRHASTHAAGVIISDKPLTNSIAIQEGHNNVHLTQFPMDILEEMGLLKMDFLGLRNLTLIQNISSLITRKTGKRVELHNIPLNDETTFRLLGQGDTTGVFQLESEGMRKVLTRLKPTQFEDIVAVNALYRPGPMENIPVYIERKHGKRIIEYLHPDLEPILKKTYGVIVYQEQIMQIASKIAGFSLGEADILRRAVSKKKKEVLDRERIHFVNGCIKNGYAEQIANDIYDLIVRFANYGFNRSHAVAYSIIAYQLAYLKANFPFYFMAAILTSAIGNDEKIAGYIREAKQKGIKILPPSINKSIYSFRMENGGIRYSLACIKNVGDAAIKEIIKCRNEKRFEDLFDLCSRVSLKIINRRVLESLIVTGCFDEFGKDRAVLLASLDVALEYADLIGIDQEGLFLGDDLIPKPQYVEAEPMDLSEKLNYEVQSLGLFLSSHPVKAFEHVLESINSQRIADISSIPSKSSVNVGCFVTSIKVIKTKKGEKMAFLQISDETAEIDVVVFPKIFHLYGLLIEKEPYLYIKGKIEERDEKRQLIADEMISLSVLKKHTEQTLYLKIDPEVEQSPVLLSVKEILKKNSGFSSVNLYYSNSKKTVRLSNEWNVNSNEECIGKLRKLLGPENVVLRMSSLQ